MRQYRMRLKKWKIDKNVKTREMKSIVKTRQKRKLVETHKRHLEFWVRGFKIGDDNIDRWMKRHDVTDSTLYAPDSPLGKAV
jgi:hypothetical protein